MKRITIGTAICCMALIQSASAADGQIKRFKAGDVIYAEDVNSNFQALADTIKKLEQRIADLETQNRALQAEIAALKKQPVASAPTSTPRPATQTSPTKTPQYSLRSIPTTVSDTEAQKVFGLDPNMRPLQYMANDFERKGDIVIDHATGLTWQQTGSLYSLTYREVQDYVQRLNLERFAGYIDWRLPTIPELLSLMTKERQTNGLYLNPVFDAARWCLSSDQGSADSDWTITFITGNVKLNPTTVVFHVRAVRSGQ